MAITTGATATGELTVFRPGELVGIPLPANLPMKVDPGVVVLMNVSTTAVWIDPRRWTEAQTIVGVRAPSVAGRIAAFAAKVSAVFAVGFSSALLYSAEPSDRGEIRIMLPPPEQLVAASRPAPITPATDAAPMSPMQPQSAAAAIVPAVAQPAAAPAPARPSSPAALAITDLAQVRAASDLAIRTGVAQPWRGAGLHGYAVAGPIQFVGGGACRIVAVWVEAQGTPGKSLSLRRCLAEGGKWERGATPGATGGAGSADSPDDLVS